LIEKRRRRDRKGRAYTVYRVRWKDDAGRERSKTLPRGTKKDEVEDFERRVMTMKRAGALAQLDKGRQPLMEFVPEWWETYASPNLTRETLRRYAEVWNAHVLPRLGHYRLSELTPEVVSRFGAELQRAGVGANTRHKALTFLSGVLRTGVEWGRVPTNPVRDVRKPTVRRQRPVRPLSPEQGRGATRGARPGERQLRRCARLRRPAARRGPAASLAGHR
jgi:Phage integrase, N-terminal SAM-like domain